MFALVAVVTCISFVLASAGLRGLDRLLTAPGSEIEEHPRDKPHFLHYMVGVVLRKIAVQGYLFAWAASVPR
jgi:hypothetical protein